MRLGQLTLRPATVPTVAMLIAVPLFTALGTWQLERAETKRGLRAEVAARWDAAPASLPARPDWTTLEHSRVTVEGAFVD